MADRTLRDVSSDIGISHSTLSRVLKGKTPDLHTFVKIFKWLDISPSYLLCVEMISFENTEKAVLESIGDVIKSAKLYCPNCYRDKEMLNG